VAGGGTENLAAAWQLINNPDQSDLLKLRLRFDVTFQLREYPHILFAERPYDQGLRHLCRGTRSATPTGQACFAV
jgi:hypothetical protein